MSVNTLNIKLEDAEVLLSMLKANFLKAHRKSALYGAHNLATIESPQLSIRADESIAVRTATKEQKQDETARRKENIIARAVKNGDAPEIAFLMKIMGLINNEEKTDEIA